MVKNISILWFMFVLSLLMPFYFYTNYHGYSAPYTTSEPHKSLAPVNESPSHIIIDEFKFNTRLMFLDKHEWIVQYNVAQYSSILVEQLDGTVDIEAQFFHDKSTNIEYIRTNVKCFAIMSGKDLNSSIIIDPFEVLPIDAGASIWIIKCKLKESEIKNFQPSIAIVDKNDFGLNPHKNALIKLQKPSRFKRSVPKKKQIAHCVHLVRDLDENRLKNLIEWIFIQRKLNMAKISLYFQSVINKNDVIEKIRKANNDESFVKIIDYKTNFGDFCKFPVQSSFKNRLNMSLIEKSCKESYDIHFSKVPQKHEKINTNDCYLNYKYEYEYVSNYDFDEFIFPRLDQTKSQSQLLFNKSNCSDMLNYSIPKYDLYSYAKYLHDLLGGSRVAYLRFDNRFSLIQSRSFLNNILKFSSLENSIEYLKNDVSVRFKIKNSDKEFIENLKKSITLIDCLNGTTKNRINLNVDFYKSKWNNAYSFRTFDRDGKSIYATDYTQTINVHAADNMNSGKNYVHVPLNYGFVSHFRVDFDVNSIRKETFFKEINADLEYILFFYDLAVLT
jgi:hypothetical protein